MSQQGGLDLDRVHVLPAREDQVLQPIHDQDRSPGVDGGEVPRVEPATRWAAAVASSFCQYPGLIVGPRTTISPTVASSGGTGFLGVDHAQLHGRERGARAREALRPLRQGELFLVLLELREGQVRRGLRQAVGLAVGAAKGGQHALDHRRGDGRSAGEAQAQRPGRVGPVLDRREHALEHGRHEVREGHPVALTDLEATRGVEPREERVGPPDGRDRERRPGVREVEHGGEVAPCVVPRQLQGLHSGQGVSMDVAVRRDDALRVARGPTGASRAAQAPLPQRRRAPASRSRPSPASLRQGSACGDPPDAGGVPGPCLKALLRLERKDAPRPGARWPAPRVQVVRESQAAAGQIDDRSLFGKGRAAG